MSTSFTHDSARLAETYDRLSDHQLAGGKVLVERMEIKPGASVLDVGCGTGRLTRWIAERLGEGGRVTGIDPLPERIGIARANAPSLDFEVGQAEDLGAFPDESFDAVCMSAVFHWVADKPKALREVRRVLRPGGGLGVTTLARELMGATTVAKVLAPLLGRSPYVEKADLSALAVASRGHTTTELISMVMESGLVLRELGLRSRGRLHATAEEAVDFLESSSFGNFLRVVPEDLRPPLRKDLVRALEEHRGPDGVVMHDYGMFFYAER
jgi:arsenite methyltransferase